MELKVWVEGVQRVVCGVTETTTCQDVVIALAQALGRTGRYTLIEQWRNTERNLSPMEAPLLALAKWGQHSGDVCFILRCTGPTRDENVPEEPAIRPSSHHSLPSLAKQRTVSREQLRRKEPKRKSLTFTGGVRGITDLFNGTGNVHGGTGKGVTDIEELKRIIKLQKQRLHALDSRLTALSTTPLETLDEVTEESDEEQEEGGKGDGEHDIVAQLEAQIAQNEQEILSGTELQAEVEEGLQKEEEMRRTLALLSDETQSLKELLEQQNAIARRLQEQCESAAKAQEVKVRDLVNGQRRGDAREPDMTLAQLRANLNKQEEEGQQVAGSLAQLEKSVDDVSHNLKVKEGELENLNRDLRQLYLQHFIEQTGSRVTALLPSGDETTRSASEAASSPTSTRVPISAHVQHRPLLSALNQESVFV
uniref:ras association domain-containing protein 8-like n=1 Tax=Myxine glutinosa TaxID=7769 RepID=UPI00358EE297